MIKSNQISELTSAEYKWHYLTSITKEQIRSLLKKGVFQLDLFADEIMEVEDGGIRYILHRNQYRAKELQENRAEKIRFIETKISEQNQYLQEHNRAKVMTAVKKIEKLISRLKLDKILTVKTTERTLSLHTDAKELSKKQQLDGCYVIKTNVPAEALDTQTAHDRYKELSKVEFAFRTMKTTMEQIRPIFVRKEENTRGHVFVVMLGYMIIKYITDMLSELNYSRKYIFECLDKIRLSSISISSGTNKCNSK